jgi:hypothetical protein
MHACTHGTQEDDVDLDEEVEPMEEASAPPLGTVVVDGGRRRSMRVAGRQQPPELNPILFTETSKQFAELVTSDQYED